MITAIGQAKKIWIFADILGMEIELDLESGTDVEAMCCHLVERSGLPIRCYPKLFLGNAVKRGEIIRI